MVLDNFAFIFTSSDYLDKNDAERSIKDYCRATSQGACTVAQTFSDTCGAVAYAKYQGKPKYFFATDEDPKRAERKALDQCFAKYGDNDCYFYPAQCTGLKYGRTPALYTQVKQEAVNEQTQAAQRALQKWQSTGEAVPRQ